MSDKPRRFWHLSTAVVLMLVSGALIYANATEVDDLTYTVEGEKFSFVSSGWPFHFTMTLVDGVPMRSIREGLFPLLNILVGISILIATTLFLEHSIRRRSKP